MGSYAGTYAPIRDAFNDLNKLIIDKQRWEAEHAYRAQDLGLKTMMAEQQMQDQALRREGLKVEAEQARRKMEMVPVSINDYIKPDPMFVNKLTSDPEYRQNVARLYNGTDIDIATMKPIGADGNPITMRRMEAERRSAGLMPLVLSAIDPAQGAQNNINALDSSISGLQKELNAIPDNDINKKIRGEKRAEIAKFEGARRQYEDMLTPENLLKAYRAKETALESGMQMAYMNGAGPDYMSMMKSLQDTNKGHITLLESKLLTREQSREAKATQKEIAERNIQGQKEIHAADALSRENIEKMKLEADKGSPVSQEDVYFLRSDGTLDPTQNKKLTVKKRDLLNNAQNPEDIDPKLAPSPEGRWVFKGHPAVRAQEKASESKRDPSKTVADLITSNYGMADQEKGLFNFYSGYSVNHIRAARDIATKLMKQNPGEKNSMIITQEAVRRANEAVREYSARTLMMQDQMQKDLDMADSSGSERIKKFYEEEQAKLDKDWNKVFSFKPDMSEAATKPFAFKPNKDEED